MSGTAAALGGPGHPAHGPAGLIFWPLGEEGAQGAKAVTELGTPTVLVPAGALEALRLSCFSLAQH